MKRKLLLLVGALVWVFTTASAWNKPAAPASQALVTDGETAQYLYNVGAEGFMLGANDYQTRASISKTHGVGWKVEMLDENGPYYALINYVEKFKEWRRMFCDNMSSVWVDNNNGANNGTWKINPDEGNNFTIGNDAVDGQLGIRPADTNDTRCYFTSAYPEEVLSTLWYSVSEEEYNKYVDAVLVYEAAVELKAAIDAAKEKYPNIDLSAQEAVYNNENSTLEELKEAIAGVDTAVKEAAKQEAVNSASVGTPYDMTSYIVNPNFDGIKFDGWKGSGWGAGGTTDECAERYDMTFDTYQDIENLPKGVYRILVNGFFRGNVDNTPYLYGASTTDTLKTNIKNRDLGGSPVSLSAPNEQTVEIDGETFYVPNTMQDFVIYENQGFYTDIAVVVPVNEDGKLRIGVKKDKNTGGDWTIVDTFRLLYLGDAAEAYQVIMDNYLETLPDYSEVDATESLKDAYTDAVKNHSTATNMDEVRDNIAAIEEAMEAIKVNVAAWAKYKEILDKAQQTLQQENIDQTATAVLELSDYLMEAEDFVNNKELTTEEIEAEIEKLEDMISAAMQCLKSGADFTLYLKNPEMDSKEGWNGNPTINAKCGEKYGSGEFDVYQIVDADVPVGLYEISMQGFYRQYRDDDDNKTAWYNIFEDTEDARTFKVQPADREAKGLNLAYVYMNSNKTPLNCVYDYAQEITSYDADTKTATCDFYGSGFSVDPRYKYAYPNTMANAAAAFADGAYKVSAYGLVAKAGDKLRLGVKGNLGNTGNCWAIFDNFKLTFCAKDETVINKLLPDAKAAIDLAGKKVGKDVRELVETTLQKAESAANADEKFEALALCFDLGETIEASVKLFENLYAAMEELETAISNAENVGVAEETKTAAAALMVKATAGYNEETFTDAEATETIKEIEEMIKLLLIPAFIGSDDNPIDFTGFIKDADFDGISVSGNKYGAWSWTKKEGNGPNFTNAFEFWADSAANLQFSITQEISGLPAGKYELKAQAANSFNGQATNGADGRAYLFAEVGADKVRHSVAVEPKEDDATAYDDYSVIFTLAKDEVVTVGFKTIGTMCARWFSGDTFQLVCYGTESTKADTGDAASIEDVMAEDAVSVPTAIYNAAGVKTSTLSKGLNIIRMSNGKTIKVMVK